MDASTDMSPPLGSVIFSVTLMPDISPDALLKVISASSKTPSDFIEAISSTMSICPGMETDSDMA